MSESGLAIQLFVAGRSCLLIGQGAVVDERQGRLAAAGAQVVHVRATEVTDEQLAGADIVMICETTPDALVVAAKAARGRALVYVHDRPDLSDFAMPALVRSGDFQLAISTGGRSPGLAGRLRACLEEAFGDDWAALVEWLGAERERLRQAESDPGRRREQMAKLIDGLELEAMVRWKQPGSDPGQRDPGSDPGQ